MHRINLAARMNIIENLSDGEKKLVVDSFKTKMIKQGVSRKGIILAPDSRGVSTPAPLLLLRGIMGGHRHIVERLGGGV